MSERRIAVSWSGSHPDGAELRYAILFSPDEGASWIPLAVDREEQNLTVDTTLVRSGDRCKIRLLATDGFTTAVADSRVFGVPAVQSVNARPMVKQYLGNSGAMEVHDLWEESRGCMVEKIIGEGAAVTFSRDTLQHAHELGYHDCKSCIGERD
ncbi:MAG: hypothetical protein ACM3ML_24640 [Micromonosporaceae bacterium]